MELVSGKLYEAICQFEFLPETYLKTPWKNRIRERIEKGSVLMFVRKRAPENELIFLHSGKLITGASRVMDREPQLFLQEVIF